VDYQRGVDRRGCIDVGLGSKAERAEKHRDRQKVPKRQQNSR
jgi:hypothetical protein